MASEIVEVNHEDLLHIQPQEIYFTFELGKQSSCSIELTNFTHNHVAFKVKTTHPNKYRVVPNPDILQPNSNCNVTVTMRAHSVAPPDSTWDDMFLIQSTVVPRGTAREDITSNIFSEESGRFIGEKELKVFLTRPPQSSVSDAINEVYENLTGFEIAEDAMDDPDKFEELKSKINFVDSKLKEVTQEWRKATEEKDVLQGELETLKTKYIMELTQEKDELRGELALKVKYIKKLTQEKDKLHSELKELKAKELKAKDLARKSI